MRLNQAQQRAIREEEDLKTQKIQNEQTKLSLKMENERSVFAKEALDRNLFGPTLVAPSISTSDEAICKEHEELTSMLKAKER